MNGRRICTLAVPALVAGLLALPAAAEPDGEGDRSSADGSSARADALRARPDMAFTDIDSRRAQQRLRTPADALTARKAPGPASWLRAAAAATAAAGGPSAGVGALVLAPEPPSEGEPEPFEMPSVPFGAGDLDGDGRADLLTWWSGDEGLVLDAQRGSDGSLLWSRPVDGDGALVFPAYRDLTGDGADDLLVDVFTFDGESSRSDAGYDYAARFTQAYGVASGADGGVLWRRDTAGSVKESYRYTADPLGLQWEESLTVELDNLVLPLLSEDLTGDGSGDLAVNEISLRFTGTASGTDAVVAGADTMETSLRSTTRGLAVDGRTGDAEQRRTVAQTAGLSYLVPVGDLTGTGAGDLLWATETVPDHSSSCVGVLMHRTCDGRSEDDPEVVLERLDGRTGVTLWTTRDAGGDIYVFPLAADADGDGVDDLGLESYADGRLLVVSGADGAVLWERADERQAFLAGVERRGGQGVATLVAFDVRFPSDPLDDSAVRAQAIVTRVDAGTGGQLSETRHEVPVASPPDDTAFGWFGLSIYAGALTDAGGDGGQELLLGSSSAAGSYDPVEEEAHAGSSRSWTRVESLSDGAALLEETSEDERYLLPYGDLDGDGRTDVVREVVVDRTTSVDATALRLTDGEELWRFTGDFWQLPRPAGDQDGLAGEELMVVADTDAGPVVRSLRGADLGLRWELPAKLLRGWLEVVVVVD